MDDSKLHHEIMQGALKDPEPKPNRLAKIVLIGVGVLVILAFLIAFLGGGQSIRFIESRLTTSTATNEYVLNLADGREIHLSKEVFLELQSLMTMDSAEFKACLLGEKNKNIYTINEMYIPKIFNRDYHSVLSEPCNESTIISLHSHPTESCKASDQDLKNLESFKETNPDALMGIMCGFNRFIFYG